MKWLIRTKNETEKEMPKATIFKKSDFHYKEMSGYRYTTRRLRASLRRS